MTLAVFIYRDVWPLATYEQVPEDATVEGPIFWAKLAILAIIALVVPLFVPTKYIPLDPEVRKYLAILCSGAALTVECLPIESYARAQRRADRLLVEFLLLYLPHAGNSVCIPCRAPQSRRNATPHG